jgi:SEC-C motif
MKKHEWRAMIQYKLTDEEARQMVEGYGHPEVDNAPVTLLAAGERPASGDPRVFLGTHNMLREEAVVVCWNCELAWDPELARKECTGESIFAFGPRMNDAKGIGNIRAGLDPVGRNDPCPCGSGVKFKRCHGAN